MTEKLLIVLSAMAFLWNQSQSAYSAELELRQSSESKMKKVVDGIASFYADQFHGRRTANGDRFDMNGMTCAHKYLPFGTQLLVKNAKNGKTCVVTVNDRGPYWGSRVIDLSKAAARKLGINGVGRVMCYSIGNSAKSVSGLIASKKPLSNAIASARTVKSTVDPVAIASNSAARTTPVAKAPKTPIMIAANPAKSTARAGLAAAPIKQKSSVLIAAASATRHPVAAVPKPSAPSVVASAPTTLQAAPKAPARPLSKLVQTAMTGKALAKSVIVAVTTKAQSNAHASKPVQQVDRAATIASSAEPISRLAQNMLATQPKAVPVAYNYADGVGSISVDTAESPLLQFATSVH